MTDEEFLSRYNTSNKTKMKNIMAGSAADYHSDMLKRKQKLKTEMLKRALIVCGYEMPISCQKCGWDKVSQHTGRVPLEFNHIDGNCENNDPVNIEVICPNCHALEPTNKGLNKKLRRLQKI